MWFGFEWGYLDWVSPEDFFHGHYRYIGTKEAHDGLEYNLITDGNETFYTYLEMEV